MLIRILFLFLLLLALPALLGAAPVQTDNVEAELVARTVSLAPGETTVIGLRLKHAPHWHTYWQNPGDSGMPTTIQWKLPAGFKAGQILWPVPRRIPLPPLMNHGYEGEIVLPVEITVPKDWPAGQDARLAARADWLVCKDVCIPGGADLTLSLPVVAASAVQNPKWAALFDAAFAAMPVAATNAVQASTRDSMITLRFAGARLTPGREAFVLPSIEGLVEHGAAQRLTQDGDAVVATLTVAQQLTVVEPRFAGVVVGIAERALSFTADMPGKLVASAAAPPRAATRPALAANRADPLSLSLALVFALFGGMVLNLMPCVFPILSLKILGFAQGADRKTMRSNGLAYAAGVIVSFLGLAVLLLGLRAAGDAVGWGFQLQSPVVVTLLALLFFVLGLNLSGVFEFGQFVPSGVAGVSARRPLADAFVSGVLAAVIASPCTAPFMGAALGYAVTQNAGIALAVFGTLGLGMAIPYVLLAWFPAWLKRLPKPGPWLVTFKQLLAFPMYATVVWLAWVLLLQIGADAIVWFGAGLVVVAFGAWLLGRSAGAAARAGALTAALAGIALAMPGDPSAAIAASSTASQGWIAYSKSGIEERNAAGTPVFVDFTAAWCVTCQVNKKLVLESGSIRQAFAAKRVTLMRGDWTRRDAEISAALAELGRNGVPVYALFAPGKPVVLLPEILREQIVLDALKEL